MGGNGSCSHAPSSLGDYSNEKSFGAAFKAAHERGGLGHTFMYKGNKYSTDTADGGDYSKKQDRYYDRTSLVHEIHEIGHLKNAKMKDESNGQKRLDKLDFTKKGKTWSADVDRQQAEFHRIEKEKKAKIEYEKLKDSLWQGPKF